MSKKKSSLFSSLYNKLMTLGVIIIIGLVLIEGLIDVAYDARYAPQSTEDFVVDSSVSNVTTLQYGFIRKESKYITVEANGTEIMKTGTPNYTITSEGSYTSGAELTYDGFDNAKVYDVNVQYHYSESQTIVSMTTIIPVLGVLLILAIVVGVIMFFFSKIYEEGKV